MVVGDYFKLRTAALEYTDLANNLITWLRSKTLVLALLRTAQEDATGTSKSVIRAVLTRWTAHYQAYKRMLELRASLVAIIAADDARPSDKKLIVTGDRKAKDQARKMITIIMDPVFWHALTRYVFLDGVGIDFIKFHP